MTKGYWNVKCPDIFDPVSLMFDCLTAVPGKYLDKYRGFDIRTSPGYVSVIIEFESLAAAKAAYDYADYLDLKLLRDRHCKVGISVIAEGDHAAH